ncbi:MAG: sterol desaturase family protein [Acidimicrobiales bacterium]|jgi:sterol desaturase/sphingolipid hydroxylase (fatty acid hydroxylase superfamily)
MKGVSIALMFTAGVLTWTFAEYCLHRWMFHPRRMRWWKRPTASEHLAHHSAPVVTSPAKRIGALTLTAAGAVPAALMIVMLWPHQVTAAVAGWAFGAGWVFGYTTYELVHWRSHHIDTRSKWTTGIRLRHFAHHFTHVRSNYGITVTWWDRAFGTYRPVGVTEAVTVPQRHAPTWLVNQWSARGDDVQPIVGLRISPETMLAEQFSVGE